MPSDLLLWLDVTVRQQTLLPLARIFPCMCSVKQMHHAYSGWGARAREHVLSCLLAHELVMTRHSIASYLILVVESRVTVAVSFLSPPSQVMVRPQPGPKSGG